MVVCSLRQVIWCSKALLRARSRQSPRIRANRFGLLTHAARSKRGLPRLRSTVNNTFSWHLVTQAQPRLVPIWPGIRALRRHAAPLACWHLSSGALQRYLPPWSQTFLDRHFHADPLHLPNEVRSISKPNSVSIVMGWVRRT